MAMRWLSTILIAIFLLLQYRLWFQPGGVREIIALHSQIKQIHMQNQKLEARNLALMAEVNDLKEGHQAIEERARSELGMIKKDEHFYQIIVPKHPATITSKATDSTP